MEFATEFKSKRLVAFPVQANDWSTLLEATTSSFFPKDLPLARITSKVQAQNWITSRINDWNNGFGYVWSIRQQCNLRMIGQISLFPRKSGFALAYWVSPEVWGKGFATEICRALIQHLKEVGYQGLIWAGAHDWNKASSSVLLKAGFNFTTKSECKFINGETAKITEHELEI